MDANVELGEMEPERSRSRAEIGQAAVCDPRASMRAEQLVESVEIGEQRRPVVIFVLTETPEDVDERAGVAEIVDRLEQRYALERCAGVLGRGFRGKNVVRRTGHRHDEPVNGGGSMPTLG